MDGWLESFKGVLRVVFLRGSPERIFYTRKRFIVGLLAAVLFSGLVQAFYFGDHLVFVILRVFAELTMFMLAMVLLTRKIPRFRLAYMMLALVFISVFIDGCLLALSPLFGNGAAMGGEITRYIAWGLGAIGLYGASSTVAWGMRLPINQGALVMALYVAAAVGLDMAFRSLYATMAGVG